MALNLSGGKQLLFVRILGNDNKWQGVALKDLRKLETLPFNAGLDTSASSQLLPGGNQVLVHTVDEENEQTLLALHERATGNVIREIAHLDGRTWHSVCSPDGRLAATCPQANARSIEIYDLSTAGHVLHIPLEQQVLGRNLMVFSPDNSLFAFSHAPNPFSLECESLKWIKLWNGEPQELRSFGSSEFLHAGVFSADGRTPTAD